jgi:hypothetical protein
VSEREHDPMPGAEEEPAGGLLPEEEDALHGNVTVGGDPFAGTQGGQTAQEIAEKDR